MGGEKGEDRRIRDKDVPISNLCNGKLKSFH